MALSDDEFDGYRNRLLGLCDELTGERLKAAASNGAAAEQVVAAQQRVLAVARRILSLEGVTLPSVHVFQDLAHISQDEARQFVGHIGQTDLALALKAAAEEVKDSILGVMSPQ